MVLSLIYSDDTTGSNVTVPGSDAALKTINIFGNAFKLIIIEALVSLDQTASSTAQAVTFKIKGGSTALKTQTHATKAVLEQTTWIPIRVAVALRPSQSLSITVAGAGADANTNVKYQSLYIYGAA